MLWMTGSSSLSLAIGGDIGLPACSRQHSLAAAAESVAIRLQEDAACNQVGCEQQRATPLLCACVGSMSEALCSGQVKSVGKSMRALCACVALSV